MHLLNWGLLPQDETAMGILPDAIFLLRYTIKQLFLHR